MEPPGASSHEKTNAPMDTSTGMPIHGEARADEKPTSSASRTTLARLEAMAKKLREDGRGDEAYDQMEYSEDVRGQNDRDGKSLSYTQDEQSCMLDAHYQSPGQAARRRP